MVAAVIYAFEEDGTLQEGSLVRLFAMAGDDEVVVPVDRGTNIRSAKQPMPRQLGLDENVRTLRH